MDVRSGLLIRQMSERFRQHNESDAAILEESLCEAAVFGKAAVLVNGFGEIKRISLHKEEGMQTKQGIEIRIVQLGNGFVVQPSGRTDPMNDLIAKDPQDLAELIKKIAEQATSKKECDCRDK